MKELEDSIQKIAESPAIVPEAKMLVELALEAQRTGRMPDLSGLTGGTVLSTAWLDLETGEVLP